MSVYDGPERRGGVPDGFRAAVKEAAFDAALEVGAIHRRRLVVQSFLAALMISSLIMGIGWYVSSSSERDFGRRHALYNCRLFTSTAQTMGDFVQSDADLRDRQNKQGLGKELSAGFAKIFPRATLVRLARAQQQDVARVVTRWRSDATRLRSLGGTDCATALGD